MVKVNTVVMSTKLDLAIKEFDPTKKGEYSGNSLKQDAFMQLYIEKLYGDQIHFIRFSQIIIIFTKEFLDYSFMDGPALWDKKKGTEYNLQDVPEEDMAEYRKTNKRFTLYPIMFTNPKRTIGDVVYMLYDKKFNQIEVFDSSYYINVVLIKKHEFFTNFFKKIYGITVRFDYTNHACIFSEYYYSNCKPERYLYKSYNYCGIWFLWFLELRLKNRSLSSKEIVYKIKGILDKNPTKICEILIGYAQFVDKLTNDYKYVIIDNKLDIGLKSSVKNAKRKKRIGGLVAGLIVLLSSVYIFRKKIKSVFRKNIVKK